MRLIKKILNNIKFYIINNIKKSIIFIGLFVISFIVLTYYSIELTSTNKFCISCHEMIPAYESYIKSSHYNVIDKKNQAQCRDCHISSWSNPILVIYDKTYHGIKDIFNHFYNSKLLNDPGYYQNMIHESPNEIRNKNCLKCHKNIFDKKYDNYINIHSELEFNSSAKCAKCHRGIVHYPYLSNK